MTNVSEPACRAVRDSTHSDGNLRERWEAHANEWIAWARAAGHDSYWRFHRDQFLQIVPPPGHRTVDIGEAWRTGVCRIRPGEVGIVAEQGLLKWRARRLDAVELIESR